MRPGSANHVAFFVHGATDVRHPTNRSAVAGTAVRAAFLPPWDRLTALNESAMRPPRGPDHVVVHYWSRDLLSYARKMARGRPNDGRGVGGPRSLRTLLRREAACAAGGAAAPSPSAAARHATVAAYLADLPPVAEGGGAPPPAATRSGGGAGGGAGARAGGAGAPAPVDGDAEVPAALGRTDGAKGAELGRRLLAGQTLAADTMCARGVVAMCTPPGGRGKYPWPWARWLADRGGGAGEALWKRI